MSLQGQLQTALENLAQAAQRLEAAERKLAAERLEKAGLQEKYDEAVEKIETMTAQNQHALQTESEFDRSKAQVEELTGVRNRLIAEKNQLLSEREQFKKFREGWGRERPALVKAKEDAEAEVRQLKENGGGNENPAETKALNVQIETLKTQNAALEKEVTALSGEKEKIAVERDGIQNAYLEIKEIAAEASVRLESTLEELKILKGEADG